ncbi:MAG: hypothetical protein QM762_12675 [Chryseolinea sp.]
MANNRDFPGAAAIGASYEIFNPLDLYQDEIYQKTMKTVPYMSSLSWLKNIKGRSGKRKVKRSEYSFYEEGQFMKAAATIAAITPSGGNFLITLSAADHTNVGGTGKSSFPVARQTVLFADGKTTGYVNSVDRSVDSAHVVTVKKLNSAQDIGTVALVGTKMIFYSNAQTERSSKTEARQPQWEKITNKMQIVREYYDSTDLEMQNQVWFETEGGKRYIWYKGIEDTAQRFEFQKETAVLLTPQASGLTDANSKSVQTAFGLIPQIDAQGITLEYYQEPDMASFDEMMLALDNNYADKKYMIGHGMNLMLKLKNFLVEFGKNGTGNLSFSPFDGGEQQAIKLNFKSYSVGAYEFYFQQWDIFSHKDSLGADGLPFRHMGVFIPAGYTKGGGPDSAPDAPAYEPYIQLVTPFWGVPVNSGIDKGDYLLFENGALANQGPTNDVMERGQSFVTYISLEMRCRHKFAKWELA